MNKLSKFALISAILLVVILLPASLNVNQQAYASNTANSNPPQDTPQVNQAFLPLFIQNPSNPLQLQPPLPCYGPHLTANISKTQVNLNETVTATGMICPPAPNQTVEVTFVRPDYTYPTLTNKFSPTTKQANFRFTRLLTCQVSGTYSS